jgi:hypothetical protein
MNPLPHHQHCARAVTPSWSARRWYWSEMTPLPLVLWREKYPEGKEQLHLPLNSELPQVDRAINVAGHGRWRKCDNS